MNKQKHLGIFDSGIGGFSLVGEIHKLMPDLKISYISDKEFMPYGNKTDDVIKDRSKVISKKLIDKNVDAILVACNTATAISVTDLREEFHVPFIGIEPFVNAINTIEELGDSSLILTPVTFKSERFQDLISRLDPNKQLEVVALHNLASLIEKSFEDGRIDEQAIIEELKAIDLSEKKSLILGCTHYPLIKDFLEKHYLIKCISPCLAVAKRCMEVLDYQVIGNKQGHFYFYCTPKNEWSAINFESINFSTEA